ncbi:uncharacterized protein LOC135829551 isoform X2 [Sycon ciliatum]|uniref:uncharacterized protein LOC135829551 isoform X2 n=1 Tax=Sycon ciliatum TaxID=27933 RepID=UPI0031F5F3EA
MHPSSNRMLGRILPRAKLLFSLLVVLLAINTCNATCPKGQHESNVTNSCAPLKTFCPGTDKAVYSWIALAGLPSHPHVDEPSRTQKTNLREARQMCRRRGYDVVKFVVFTTLGYGVRHCMEALLHEMMASSYSSPITIWTSFVYHGQHVIYKQGKNNLREALLDSHGTSKHDVICEAKWLHANNSAYAVATPASGHAVTHHFAEEACQQYGLHLISEDWLQAHGHVLRERWLKRLALQHKPRDAPFHVQPIRVNRHTLYRTVTFSNLESQSFQNTTTHQRARILCVTCNCLNQGQCDDKGKCICPKGFTGNKCQTEINESSTGSANTTQAATPTTSGITKPTSDPATTTPTEVGDEQWSIL